MLPRRDKHLHQQHAHQVLPRRSSRVLQVHQRLWGPCHGRGFDHRPGFFGVAGRCEVFLDGLGVVELVHDALTERGGRADGLAFKP